MFSKKFGRLLVSFFIATSIICYFLLRPSAPPESKKTDKVVEPNISQDVTFTPDQEDISQTSEQQRGENSVTSISSGDKFPPLQDPSTGDAAGVEKQLTRIEKALLKRGIDISRLPRGPNGELLRGPTGGIALVPNPTAPTQEDVERFEEERYLRERLAEIEKELLQFHSDGSVDKESFLHLLDLQEEQIKIQKALGFQFQGTDPLIGIKITRHAMRVMTDEGIPVSSVPTFIKLYEEMGNQKIAEMFREAAEKAEQNGETFFNFFPELHPQGVPNEY